MAAVIALQSRNFGIEKLPEKVPPWTKSTVPLMVTEIGVDVRQLEPTRFAFCVSDCATGTPAGIGCGVIFASRMLKVDVVVTCDDAMSTCPVVGPTGSMAKLASAAATVPSAYMVMVAGGSARFPVRLPVARSMVPVKLPRGGLTSEPILARCVCASTFQVTVTSGAAAAGFAATTTAAVAVPATTSVASVRMSRVMSEPPVACNCLPTGGVRRLLPVSSLPETRRVQPRDVGNNPPHCGRIRTSFARSAGYSVEATSAPAASQSKSASHG